MATVGLGSLSLQQLGSVKKQLDDEVDHLSTSFQKLKAAQNKFRECKTSIRQGVSKEVSERAMLVPLTTSLYVPGSLADSKHVIVDVGTGFYVEKTTKEAEAFYDSRIEDLEKNLKDVEGIFLEKSNNLRVVEDVLRQKVASNAESKS